MFIRTVIGLTLILTLAQVMISQAYVNATGLSGCYDHDPDAKTEFDPDPAPDICQDRSNHPEAYCLNYDQDPWCNQVNICDDEGEITSKDMFCTGEAARIVSGVGCPKGFHVIEGDESGLCYINSMPCPETDYKILQETPSYPGEYYCDNLPPKNLSKVID